MARPPLSARALALRVLALALAVGAAGTAVGVSSAWGACDAFGTQAADPVCYDLVRTLSTRMGLAAALATTIIVLTMVGLSRLSRLSAPSEGREREED
jgi:hypothetical protein